MTVGEVKAKGKMVKLEVQPNDPKAREATYERLNKFVHDYLSNPLRVCEVLYQIKNEELFLEGGYSSYTEYAFKEHGLQKSSANQYFNAGRVCKLLNEATDVATKPTNEAQLRPLVSPNLNPRTLVTIWKKALTLGGEGGVTQSIVKKAKVQHLRKPSLSEMQKLAVKRLRGFHIAARALREQYRNMSVVVDALIVMAADHFDQLPQHEKSPEMAAFFEPVFSGTLPFRRMEIDKGPGGPGDEVVGLARYRPKGEAEATDSIVNPLSVV